MVPKSAPTVGALPRPPAAPQPPPSPLLRAVVAGVSNAVGIAGVRCPAVLARHHVVRRQLARVFIVRLAAIPPARKTPNTALERTHNGLATLSHLHAPVRAVAVRSTSRCAAQTCHAACHRQVDGNRDLQADSASQETIPFFSGAYFRPSRTAFQTDRGRCFRLIADGISV